MNRKIWKALGIAVCMLALAAPRAMAKTYEVGTEDKFAEAVQEINKKSSDKINEIFLTQDINPLTGNYTLTNGKTTTIKGENHRIFIKGSNAGITVTGEETVLNLGVNGYDKKLTIEGDTGVAFITVSGGATANMYENVTLQNRQSTGNACIVIMGSKSVFNMHGGVIEKCSGAVIADSGATFHMLSGKIRNCERDNDGIIVVAGKSKFIMDGGTISGCKANTGGGLYADNSTIEISGGTISGCEANAGAGGGLYAKNESTITINKGTISGCKAWSSEKGNGGGLYANNSAINISDGTISGCEGRWGGGLYVEGSTVTIKGGTISGCTARNNGGGLYATNSSTNSSIVNISGGTISGCTGVAGGGLYADKSTVTISGGTIKGNEAVFSGGGLYADKSTITINNGTISECKAAIKNGGGLYATNGSTINIGGGTISGCEGNLGCGLYANHSTIEITDGTISGCKGGRGGGLYAENSSTIEISGGIISGCKVGAGGGLFVDSSTIRISGGTISECTTTPDTGKGGGLYAENSIITISGGTIENNEAAHGGGVALTKSTVKKDEQPIRNWTVVGNKAYKTGGGIWLGENVKWDISDRTKQIYNNQAIEHGADICLEGGNSSIKLPIAANMYHDSSINIDNWYKDDNPRHKPSESGEVVKANKWLNGGLSLVASYTVIPVHIEIDTNGGAGGSSSQTVHKGTTVTLEAPTREGHLFKGWKDEKGNSYPAGEDGKVNITVNENMKLTAVWEARSFTVTYVLLDGKTRTETAAYGQNVTLVEEPRTGYTFVGWKDGEKVHQAGETITVTGDMTLTAEWKKLPSAENLPKTGDESPVLLWGAALAVSAAACFMLRRKK